jgi:hypothetical protein
MPPKAHLSVPNKPGTHTMMECDEVLARGCPSLAITDAWLDERLLALDALSLAALRSQAENAV